MASKRRKPEPAAKEPIFQAFDARNGRTPAVAIAPSILSSDFAWPARELSRCRQAKAPWIHVDIMDGHFVPNLTLGPPVLAKWTAAEPNLFYDTHLMIERPMNYAEEFAEAGSNLITIHIETTSRPRRDLKLLRRLGVKTGVTLKPKTPLKTILPILDEVDLVLVMTVEPGFGGQSLIPTTLNKVRELDLLRRREGLSFRLQVDGGINPETAHVAVAAGADVLVAGAAVFREGRIRENLKALRASLESANRRPKTGGGKPGT